jgi:hypothetical protein
VGVSDFERTALDFGSTRFNHTSGNREYIEQVCAELSKLLEETYAQGKREGIEAAAKSMLEVQQPYLAKYIRALLQIAASQAPRKEGET